MRHRCQAADLVIEDLAADLDRREQTVLQTVSVIVHLAEEILMWQAFADRQYRARAAAERRLQQHRARRAGDGIAA